MAADVSRIRFDARHDFAGVALQQGRVLLDADFNELVALLDRRLRAETNDLTSFGPDPAVAGVAWVPKLTPQAFEITSVVGDLAIGPGRMYVDGHVAENHGGPQTSFDPLLAEVTGAGGWTYRSQPYWDDPGEVPADGSHLAYLDVWPREVTQLEDPSLIEIAVGVDSSTRVQTAWQVRLHRVADDVTCNTPDADIDGWLDVIRPSSARLTNGTTDVDPDDDPCTLPPTGGYRGLENQTYRVEVHRGGSLAEATFKWSRDNASVAVPVLEVVSATSLHLASLGRDEQLGITDGMWIEIIDDVRELDRVEGFLAKVTVGPAGLVTLSSPLPADLQLDSTAAAARHLRARRWDQAGLVRDTTGATVADLDGPLADGAIPTSAASATAVVLECGLTVRFDEDPAGGRFHPGDHWVFVARTADASFEQVTSSPPLGVHHHYARLGIVSASGVTDCRRSWPPTPVTSPGTEVEGHDCSCTVCVTEQSHESEELTIQDAIALVKEQGGGTVCLGVGKYDVGAGITIDRAIGVTVRGQGLGTRLLARGQAVLITHSAQVTLEDLAIVSGAAGQAAIRIESGIAITLRDLGVLSYGNSDGVGTAIALSGALVGTRVERNVLAADWGIATAGGHGAEGVMAFEANLKTDGNPDAESGAGALLMLLHIEDNVIVARQGAIALRGPVLHVASSRITGNDLLAGAIGIDMTGVPAAVSSLYVGGNTVEVQGAGIVTGPSATVEGNTVASLGQGDRKELFVRSYGIVVGSPHPSSAPGQARVSANQVSGFAGAGISLRGEVDTLVVADNVVEACGAGIEVAGRGRARHVAIDRNRVHSIGGGEKADRAVGIGVALARSATITDNVISGVGVELASGLRAGVLAAGVADIRISGNQVSEIGPPDGFDEMAAGVVVYQPFTQLTVAENIVHCGPEGKDVGAWRAPALYVGSVGDEDAKPGTHEMAMVGSGMLLMSDGDAELVPLGDGHATASSNHLTGGGLVAACRIRTEGDVVADGNQVTQRVFEDRPIGMFLHGATVTAAANRIRGDRAMLVLEVDPERFAATGNLTAEGSFLGTEQGPAADLPGIWHDLNPAVH